MKFTILILLLSTFSVLSQETKFNLILKDSCSNKIIVSDLYHLERNGKSYSTFDSNDGTITLPEKGIYKLFASEIGEIHEVEISEKINSDTLFMPKIREFLVTHTKPNYIFKNCEIKCDGLEIGYYSNGSIRLIAEFKKGLVIGKLKRYYQNGKIKEVSFFNKRGILIKKTLFDKNGKTITE